MYNYKLQKHIDKVEKKLLKEALKKYEWSITKTADKLAVHRKTIEYKMRRLGIKSKSVRAR